MIRTRTARLVLALALVPAFTAACSSGSTKPTQSAVAIKTFRFNPSPLKISAGTTVVWTNQDQILHTVTSGTREYDPIDSGKVVAAHPDGAFNAELDGVGKTLSHEFSEAGTFHYFCNRHPGMEADIVVTNKGA